MTLDMTRALEQLGHLQAFGTTMRRICEGALAEADQREPVVVRGGPHLRVFSRYEVPQSDAAFAADEIREIGARLRALAAETREATPAGADPASVFAAVGPDGLRLTAAELEQLAERADAAAAAVVELAPIIDAMRGAITIG
jgi:hypothetical protein